MDGSRGEKHTKDYSQLNFLEARKNAYSYAQFAVHISYGMDHRFTRYSE